MIFGYTKNVWTLNAKRERERERKLSQRINYEGKKSIFFKILLIFIYIYIYISFSDFFREKNKVICLSLIFFEYLAKKKKEINNPDKKRRSREIKGDKFVSVNIFLEHLVPKLITQKKSEKKEGRDKGGGNFSVGK